MCPLGSSPNLKTLKSGIVLHRQRENAPLWGALFSWADESFEENTNYLYNAKVALLPYKEKKQSFNW